jgi:hypothetical protein
MSIGEVIAMLEDIIKMLIELLSGYFGGEAEETPEA